MKRTLTGIAAASMVLGMTIPAAFASTSSTNYNHREISVGGYSVSANGIAATDPWTGSATEFMPIWYLQQGLKAAGNTVKWDGTTQSLWITTANGSTTGLTAIAPVKNDLTIYINGVPVVNAPRAMVKNDPATKRPTSFLPIYYLSQALKQLGYTQVYDGAAGTWEVTPGSSTTPPAQTGTVALSNLAVTGQSSGNGSAGSPATALNGGSLSFSTTLTDASGNPIANTQITFGISNGNAAATGLTVMSGGNNLSSSGSSSTATDYQAYTNSNGVASISVAGPSGTTSAYTVNATAPYQMNGSALSAPAVNAEFVAPGQVGITPLGTSLAPYDASFGTAQPVTVILPPENGTAQSNVSLNFTVSSGHGYFTNSSGADLGNTNVTAYTNSAGQATVWLNDSTEGEANTVTVTGSTPYTTVNQTTTIQFAQVGVASQINGLSVSNSNPTAGQNVTISGTVVDAAGNPVANAQLLLVGGYNSSNATNSYVVNGTSTAFPDVSIAQGVPATSDYGQVLTTNSAGVFSATVTDSSAEADGYALYSVQNGVVASGTPMNESTTATHAANGNLENGSFTTSVTYSGSGTLANIAAYASAPGAPAASDSTSASGIQFLQGNTGNTYFAPVSSSSELTQQSFTYNLSASNGGDIKTIDGVNLLNSVSATTANVSYHGATTSTAGYYLISVPGGFAGGYNYVQVDEPTAGGLTAAKTVTGATLPTYTDASDLEVLQVGVTNTATGNTVLTAQSGSAKATSTFDVLAGSASKLANVSPVSGAGSLGSSSQMSFTVEDSQGNPVTSSLVELTVPTAATHVWITAINNQNLQMTESTGTGTTATEPTPIPLYAVATPYSSVSMPGIVSASGVGGTTSLAISAYTNAQGQVTLTLQNGGVSYYNGASAPYVASTTGGTGTSVYLGYNSTTFGVYLSGAATVANQDGQITW